MTHPTRLTRRALLRGAAGALGLSLTARGVELRAQPAAAEPPLAHYRFELGAFALTAVLDTTLQLSPGVLGANMPEKFVEDVLARHHVPPGALRGAVNVLLIESDAGRTLVDAGGGAHFGGRLLATLEGLLGLGGGDIDTVLISHAHPDHVCGLTDAEGRPAFPNARHLIARAERDFWFRLPPDTGNPGLNGTRDLVVHQLGAVESQLESYDGEPELLPGVTALEIPGHTPGHRGFLIESQGQRLLHLADAAIHHVVSLEHPGWHFGFDVDPEAAVASRTGLLSRAGAERLKVFGYHFPFPGLGYPVPSPVLPDRYAWVASL